MKNTYIKYRVFSDFIAAWFSSFSFYIKSEFDILIIMRGWLLCLIKQQVLFFNKYGEIVNELTKHQTPKLSRTIVKLKDKSFDNFMFYTSDIYGVRVQSGIVMLVVTGWYRSYERFVVHRHIKIRKALNLIFMHILQYKLLEVEMDFKAKKRQMSTYDHNPIVYEPIVPTFEIKRNSF